MTDVMLEVEERSNLAGTNKFELLIFRLGEDRNSKTRETFGVNVFKVREALIMPAITPMPGAPKHLVGVANIRAVWDELRARPPVVTRAAEGRGFEEVARAVLRATRRSAGRGSSARRPARSA